MECPFLSAASNRRICRLMVGQRLDGELDHFDLTHYCKGNLNHCYFYRCCGVQKPTHEQLKDSGSQKIQAAFFDELSKLRSQDAEAAVAQDDSHPLLSKLIKGGLGYKAKPELVDKFIARLRRK